MRITVVQVLMALALLRVPITAQAQTSDGGLPGPVLDRSLYDIEKTETNCQKCLAEQSTFHAAVDQYNAARATYEEGIDAVRRSTETYLQARQEAARLEKAHQDSVSQIDRLLIYRPEGESYDGNAVSEAMWAEEDAFKELEEARAVLARARTDLEGKLRAVEALRRAAVDKMRAALRAQTAMYRCEFTCEPEELDLDEPLVSLPQVPVGGIPAEAIPTPENFIGIVAKCAKCQPLAEQVNQIRSARRSFASDAQSAYESMTQNLKTLERLGQEARALETQERDLYRHLLRYFSPQAPPENASFLDRQFDNLDQTEAEAALRDISQRRAANERDQQGLAKVIADQSLGLLEALAKYALYTQLLDAAQKRLADCEQTCPESTGPDQQSSIYDPAYPVPENFGPMVAACPECQHLVDQIVKLMLERREVAHDIQFDLQMFKHSRKVLEALFARNQSHSDGGDAFGPAADMEVASQTAVDLLTEIETLETEKVGLDEDVTELTDQLANWTRQIAILRPALADCEKHCAETATAPALDFPESAEPETRQTSLTPETLLDKLQPENCRAGTECTFEITASNVGEGVFNGPLFLNESRSVAGGANGAGFGDWHCSRSGGGRSIFVYPKDLIAGAIASLSVKIRLPGFVCAGTENCVEIAFAVDERALVRMVQVGLAARGFDPGIADGVPGPRTFAAVAAFGNKFGQVFDPSDMATIYKALFGRTPVTNWWFPNNASTCK